MSIKTISQLFVATFITAVVCLPALAASPLSNGYQAYHNGQYQTAVQDFQQAATQSTGVDQAKAYWGEGLAYRRMHDFGQAVEAFQQAHRIDPTDSFASSEAEYQRMLREAQHNYVGPINGRAPVRNLRTGVGMNPVTTSAGASHLGMDFLWILIGIVVVVVLAIVISANRRKKAQLAMMRGPIDNLRQNVLANIEYIDGYTDVLPKNNADSDQVRAFRQAAAAKFEQAEKILDRATEVSDMNRASGLLTKANSDTEQGRRYLDRATGGTGKIPGDDAVRPIPLPTNQQQTASVPQDQRGVSFFSSRPAPVSQLVPVTIMVNGSPRQVMATPDEAAQIQQGQMPPVRSFNVGGQSIPWYAYQDYDPYQNYWTYQNNGWRGIAGGAVAGFVGAELINSLFNHPSYGGGWNSPYGYGPGWDSWGGWNSYGNQYDSGYLAGEQAQQAHDNAFNDPYSQPLAGNPGYDQSDYGGGGGNVGNDQS
jgi:tetratricopeptide (TPR) repeat protein